jgi:hypothetical protein
MWNNYYCLAGDVLLLLRCPLLPPLQPAVPRGELDFPSGPISLDLKSDTGTIVIF